MNISKFTFVSGAGDGGQTACLMSARSLLDGRTFGDGHPSGVLRRLGIAINDGGWWASDEERTAVLMPIALDERLCAETCDASSAAEQQRARLCAEWALSFAAPLALDCAADAMRARWPDDAATMSDCARKLRLCPTRENALAAAAAYACADAASATAANAAAAYANAAVAAVAAIAAAAYANAAVAAVAAIAAAAAYGTKKIEIRNSIIALFMRLLDVRAECAA